MERKRLFVVLGVMLLALVLVAIPFAVLRTRAAAGPGTVEYGPTTSDGQPDPAYSHRFIVQLASPPLVDKISPQGAHAPSPGRLQVNTPDAQSYINQLKAEQAAFVSSMQAALPGSSVSTYMNESGATVQATYQVVFNGLAVDPGKMDAAEARTILARLPGVKHVYRDYARQPDLYASLPLINAAAAWNNAAIGGMANAGKGVKFASVDGGVYGGKYYPAAMFDGTGFSYPPGWPADGLGLTDNNNGKVIASRAYFRTWDPPAPGDEHAWPGVNGTSHGTHTASTAAGNQVVAEFQGVTQTISGVAPAAWVMSYRVFYYSVNGIESFYDAEGIAALEDMVKDGADVVNNSWGGGPSSLGGEFDALDTALINASEAGVFVSMSAGNAGPSQATMDHPSADYISVAASTTSGTYAAGRFSVTAPTPVNPALQNKPFGVADFGAPLPVGTSITYTFKTALSVDPTNVRGCNPWVGTPFAGMAAVISRGTCDFSLKVYNAQQAGATFVVIYNHLGDAVQGMGAGQNAGLVTIPSVFVGLSTGTGMETWYTAHGAASVFEVNTVAYQAGNVPDVLANFSSRGPGVGMVLKPDIVAPGVNILAQGYAVGATGEDRHKGWGQVSGTSMASPHVAGAAILLRQIHPNWSNASIKSALMSTSKYLDIYNDDGSPAQPLDMGAGRLDLTHAADPGVILDPPYVSFGQVLTGTEQTLTVNVTSVATATETYALSLLDTSGGFPGTAGLAGFTVSPASLALGPGQSGSFTVTFNAMASGGLGDHQGYILLDGANYDAHLPTWARVTYVADADVLIIDNDGSSSIGYPDYAAVYSETLAAIGYSSAILDVDAMAGDPVENDYLNEVELNAYDAVVYFTGQNFEWDGRYTVHTPISEADTYRLNEYAQNGGKIIAMGQDLSTIVELGSPGAGEFFYSFTLGGVFLSDMVNNGVISPTFTIQSTGAAPMQGLTIDLSANGDGSDDQIYVDEIASKILITDTTTSDPNYTAIFEFPDPSNIDSGTVGMVHRQQPTLEKPGISYLGRSVYTTFGLEGVNNDTGFSTREQLLQRALEWASDEPEVTITPTYTGMTVSFKATFASNITGVTGVSYRWDFGDGTAYTTPSASDTVSHTYAGRGSYVVRVEVVDSLGNHAVSSRTAFSAIYLPLVGR